ncbi:MAG: hypothetical protein JW940_38225 [Polyangiaceae bacterium]|nr:hypothetical protein [Polyangiaceae bacterium]
MTSTAAGIFSAGTPGDLVFCLVLSVLSSCTKNEAVAPLDKGEAGAGGSSAADGQGGAPEPPGGPDSCPSGPCNYQSQTGCSEEQSCQPALDEAGNVQPVCQTVGAKHRGESCEMGECARGLFCAGGTCRTVCCGGDWSVCADGETCRGSLFVHNVDSGVDLPVGAGACLPNSDCDVFEDDCADGLSCQIVDNRGSLACAKSGDGTFGDECGPDNPCSAGFLCTESQCGSQECRSCRRLCRATPAGASPGCPEAEGVCVHYARDPESIGECVPSG